MMGGGGMMAEMGAEFWRATLGVLRDVAPIVIVMLGFQIGILRRRVPHLGRVLVGLVYVVLGLAFFLFGLERALFPLGRAMAAGLTDPGFLGLAPGVVAHWSAYYWVYIFAFAIGFATTIAEPSLMAVALKAEEVSGGAVKAKGLRRAVALGVALSLAVGTFRIVTGTPLYMYMMAGYGVVVVQTLFAPRAIVPLAYDSGGVTTSTVTVPLVAALGLGLATAVPGRSALLDGFGLIALASLFPMMTVMGYAQVSQFLAGRETRRAAEAAEGRPDGRPEGGPEGRRAGRPEGGPAGGPAGRTPDEVRTSDAGREKMRDAGDETGRDGPKET